MFTSDFIWIILRQVKNKKKYRRHKINVKFSAESIPTVRISIYIYLHLEILDFLFIFDFPLFCTPILSSYLDSTGNFTRDIVSWKFFSIFIFIWIKSGNNLWKWCKIFYQKIEKSSPIFFQFSNLILSE